MIRHALPGDAAAVAGIYNYYVEETIVTFEEEPVSSAGMAARMGGGTDPNPWWVNEVKGVVAGFAYASPWKSRCAYRNSVEITVYLDPDQTGRGLGSALLSTLLADLRDRGLHAAIGGIALPNPASIALHEKFRFTQVAHFKEVGYKLGRWIDVGYWQLILDEASPA